MDNEINNNTAQTSFQYSVKEIDGDSSADAATERRPREIEKGSGITTSINIGRISNEHKPPPVKVTKVIHNLRGGDPVPSTPDSALIDSQLKEKLYQDHLKTSNQFSEGEFVA